MCENETNIRVRYGETDQMGVVYHANYASYFEVGRTEWLRQYGLTYKSMEDNGIMLPVISLKIDYKSAAKYDDILTLKTSIKDLPKVRIEFEYELFNENEKLLAVGSTVLVFMDTKRNRPTRCPDYLMKKLTENTL